MQDSVRQIDTIPRDSEGRPQFIKAPKVKETPWLFTEPQGRDWVDQLEFPQGMGYTVGSFICPTCLKLLDDHEVQTCEKACVTCKDRHPGFVSI